MYLTTFINTKEEKIEPCPECESDNLNISGERYKTVIRCSQCGYTRGGFATKETLISIWNKEYMNQ